MLITIWMVDSSVIQILVFCKFVEGHFLNLDSSPFFWILVGANFQLIKSTVGIWNLIIQNLETFEIWTFWRSDFKGSGFDYSYSPNHSKTRLFKIRTFLFWFQMFFDKMAAICPDFKWAGLPDFRSHQNPDHSQLNLFSAICNSD